MKGEIQKYLRQLVLPSLIGIVLTACGGGGGGGDNGGQSNNSYPVPVVKTGIFLDSAVAGVSYQTQTRSGITNDAGEFQYVEGETVTFSLGNIVLGSTTAGPVVTPLTIVAGATDTSNPVVSNIIRLLITLDGDGDPANGLDLAGAAAAAIASSISINSPTFEADVVSLLESIKGPGTTLVDVSTAIAHFDETLHTSWGTSVWGEDCWGTKCS